MKRLLLVAWLLTTTGTAWALTAAEQMRFADGIYLRGFYETAVSEYLLLLRDYPTSELAPAALYRTGECYRHMGNPTGAERFYRRVINEHPDSIQAAKAELRRADMALAAEEFDDAVAILEPLTKKTEEPEIAAPAWYYLGFSRWKAGDLDGADKAFARLMKDFPDSPYCAYAALDQAAMHANDPENESQMAAWFAQAVEAAATPSAKAEALFRWGDWAYRQGRYQEAADTLQALVLELPDERRARDAMVATAWSLYFLDRTPEALTWAEKVIASAGDEAALASGAYLRANCLRKMNREGEALADYERVVKNYPSSAFADRAAYEIMVTYFQRGDYEKTLAAAPAKPVAGNEADVLWMRAEAERALGRMEQANARYESLVRQYPRASSAPMALMRLGEMARTADKWEEAAELFRRLATDYPRAPTALEALKASALARVKTGDSSGALEDWDALLGKKTGVEKALRAEALLQKALVQIDLKKRSDALNTLDELLREDSEGAQAAAGHYWRGVLLADDEKWESAESALKLSLAHVPEEEIATLARLRLVVVLQRLDRMDEAADQIEPLLAQPARVAENPALVEWLIQRRFDQDQYTATVEAATALAEHGRGPAWRQIGWYWVGTAQTQLQDESAATAAYKKAVSEKAQTREGVESRLLLAALELKAGRYEQAEEGYTAAADMATGDDTQDLRVRAYFGLGEVAEAQGQPDRAARHYLSVAVLYDDPEWTPHSLFRAGEMLGQAGRKNEQAATWQELCERYPESSFARQVGSRKP